MKFTNSCDGFYEDSLDVRFTKACDNNCPFCIEKNGIEAQETNVPRMVDMTIQSGKKTVLILGGEPFLRINNLYRYIKAIRPYVENIYITTSLPEIIKHNYETFADIMNLIDGLNVSLQHWNWKINNEILHASNPFNRIDLLAYICQNNTFANKIRVSINLVKGYIDNKSELDDFLTYMENINVKHVKINELQHTPKLFVSFTDIYGIKFPSPYSHGCQFDTTLPNHNLRITLKRACFCVESSQTATLSDLAKAIIKKTIRPCESHQIVLYESGELSYGWKSINPTKE